MFITVIFVGKEFQIFGPEYKIVNCLLLNISSTSMRSIVTSRSGVITIYYMASIRFDESCNLIGQFEVRILP